MLHFPRNHYDVPYYQTTWFYYPGKPEFSYVIDDFGTAIVSKNNTYAAEPEWCFTGELH